MLVAWLQWPGISLDGSRDTKDTDALLSLSDDQTSRNKPPGNWQHLYVGRSWQKVTNALVGRLPKTRQGNQWILVQSYHITCWQDVLPISDATTPTVATTLDEQPFRTSQTSSLRPEKTMPVTIDDRVICPFANEPEAYHIISSSVELISRESK